MAALWALGVVAGFCSAFLGIGGGLVIVPVLVLWFRYSSAFELQ